MIDKPGPALVAFCHTSATVEVIKEDYGSGSVLETGLRKNKLILNFYQLHGKTLTGSWMGSRQRGHRKAIHIERTSSKTTDGI